MLDDTFHRLYTLPTSGQGNKFTTALQLSQKTHHAVLKVQSVQCVYRQSLYIRFSKLMMVLRNRLSKNVNITEEYKNNCLYQGNKL